MSAFAHREKDSAWTQTCSKDPDSQNSSYERNQRAASPSDEEDNEPAFINLAYLDLGSDSEDCDQRQPTGSASTKSKSDESVHSIASSTLNSSDCEKELPVFSAPSDHFRDFTPSQFTPFYQGPSLFKPSENVFL